MQARYQDTGTYICRAGRSTRSSNVEVTIKGILYNVSTCENIFKKNQISQSDINIFEFCKTQYFKINSIFFQDKCKNAKKKHNTALRQA